MLIILGVSGNQQTLCVSAMKSSLVGEEIIKTELQRDYKNRTAKAEIKMCTHWIYAKVGTKEMIHFEPREERWASPFLATWFLLLLFSLLPCLSPQMCSCWLGHSRISWLKWGSTAEHSSEFRLKCCHLLTFSPTLCYWSKNWHPWL